MARSPRNQGPQVCGEEGFLHEHVAARVRDLIRDGALAPGERVPSLRKLCRQFEVSMATATRAYESLEAGGWIEARPQSGFFVRRLAGADLEPPRRGEPPGVPERMDASGLIDALAPDTEAAAGTDGVTLSLALPDPERLPVAALDKALNRVQRSRRHASDSIVYTFPPGDPELRRQIAQRVAEAGARVHPDEVLVTNGCTEALSLALQCVAGPGDAIAVESPAFFNTLTLIERLGMRVLELPTDPGEGICPVAFERVLEAGRVRAALLVPSFSNPLGSCMPPTNRQRIVELATRHGVPLIEDDVYGELHFGDRRPQLLRRWDEAGLVLTASSFSKTVAPGYRVGWLLAGAWRDQALGLKHATSMATATLTQQAVSEFLQNGAYDRHLRRLRRRYQVQVEEMRLAIARHFPAGTRVTRPQGGFLLWVQLPPGVEALTVYRQGLREGIRVAPGNLFSTGDRYAGYLRLSAALALDAQVDRAIARLGRIVARALPDEVAAEHA